MPGSSARAERRQFGRRRMTCHAWVHVERRQRVACIVRNLSARGALLEFADLAPFASRFKLVVEHPPFEAQCDVRHRTANALGVYFSEEQERAAPSAGASTRQIVSDMRTRLEGRG